MNDRAMRALLALCTVVLLGAGLAYAQSVAAPVAFALFAIAMVWPVQRAVQARLGAGLGLLAAILVSLAVVLALALLSAWAFSRVGAWVAANAALFQALVTQKSAVLEGFGLPGAAQMFGELDPRLIVRLAGNVTSQLQGVLSFSVVMGVFVILGLLEVGVVARLLLARGTPGALGVLRGLEQSAKKLRAYMGVRTLMSAITGLLIYAFARAVGLDLAAEWGVLAFVLNYIPFLGSLVATLLPTVFAALQFGDWAFAVTVFLAVQGIQFVTGSYIEPRLAGRSLALSPFMVLLAVFLGALLWGMPGAFIGVPVLIAIVTLCEQFEGSRFAAKLMSGQAPPPSSPSEAGRRSDPGDAGGSGVSSASGGASTATGPDARGSSPR
jgi:predicted PurR-regulated permease PerM